MKIYALGNEDPDRLDWLRLPGGEYLRLHFRGERVGRWSAPRVAITKARERAQLFMLAGNPVVSVAAWKKLDHLLRPCVQPLALGPQLTLLNVVERCDVFDRRNGALLRSGKYVVGVVKYAFKRRAKPSPLFVIRGLESSGVFCTAVLRELVAQHALRGWGFRQVSE